MNPFTVITAIAAPLIRDNIDTDAIIPSREMKSVGKTGLADGLFAGWRYREIGSRQPNAAFVLNDPRYRDAQILLAGANVGCGSSREHAVWALAEYGFRAIVAESFNPIFRGNCVRNGIVPVAIDARSVDADGPITIDLPRQTLTTATGRELPFEIDAEAKAMLIGGLDAIDMTLTRAADIARFRQADRERRPWAYL